MLSTATAVRLPLVILLSQYLGPFKKTHYYLQTAPLNLEITF
jgi:hypothetical protein